MTRFLFRRALGVHGFAGTTPWRALTSIVRSLGVALTVLATFAAMSATATAQTARGGATPVVTVVHDADTSAVARQISEAAGERGVRVLSVLSGGGTANARDLLFQRGIDFAILRSDLTMFAEGQPQLRRSLRRLRYISHLYTDPIYVFAREPVSDLADLANRTLGILSDSANARVTATVLLRLSQIDAQIREIDPEELTGPAQRLPADAILLVGPEVKAAQALVTSGDMQLLPIEPTSALESAFQPTRVPLPSSGTGSPATEIPTLGVAIFLATFNWQPNGSRYDGIESLVAAFFDSLQELRSGPNADIWAQTDVAFEPPAWNRFAAATPARRLSTEALSALAETQPPISYLARLPRPAPDRVPAPVTAAVAPNASAAGASSGAIPVAVLKRPPFTDAERPNQGIAVEILRRSLAADPRPGEAAPQLDLRWLEQVGTAADLGLVLASFGIVLPWGTADCDAPGGLTRDAALLCDQAIFTDPLLRVVSGVYTSTATTKNSASSTEPQVICTAQNGATKSNGDGDDPLATPKRTFETKPTLAHCIAAVQTGDADGFFSTDLEARRVMSALGVSDLFAMDTGSIETGSIHAAIPRRLPNHAALVDQVNRGLARMKASGNYASIMETFIAQTWGGPEARISRQ